MSIPTIYSSFLSQVDIWDNITWARNWIKHFDIQGDYVGLLSDNQMIYKKEKRYY